MTVAVRWHGRAAERCAVLDFFLPDCRQSGGAPLLCQSRISGIAATNNNKYVRGNQKGKENIPTSDGQKNIKNKDLYHQINLDTPNAKQLQTFTEITKLVPPIPLPMYDLLLKNISLKDVHLDDNEIEIIQSVFSHRKFRKNQYILQQGDITRHENFIIQGLTRTYLVDDRGQEHVITFDKEDHWNGDLYSFFTGNPTPYNIDCLEPTEVLQISLSNLDRLLTEVPKMYIFYMKLYRNSVIANYRRVATSLSKTALERYREFQERFPNIEQRVPNHQIASYLGITPQSLSRLRKQAMEKKQ